MKVPEPTTPGTAIRRHAVESELADALRLQRLLAEISTRFVTQPAGQVDDAIEETQQLICESLDLDRSTLWLYSKDAAELALAHFWQRGGTIPLRRNFVTNGQLPWAESRVKRGEPFHFSSLDDLPPEAAHDAETLRSHGTKSNATFPLVADGNVFGALAFAMTSKERHWTEAELSGLSIVAQIFGHVISRRQAEQRAEQFRDEIERSSRASVLGELAAALAHEINQPLTTILGNAQAARRFITQGTAGTTEILTILDDIIRDDKRAGDIVRNLRQLLEGSPARRKASCLNLLVEEVSGFLRSDMVSEGIELELDLSPSLPRIPLAEVEIQQLLINLVTNAAHALMEVPPENRRIVIQTRASDGMVTLEVRDQGCGIHPEHLDRIFEPFHTTRQNGLGMGLAICRRIAEAHGGSLHANNQQSGGAVFRLSLPLQPLMGLRASMSGGNDSVIPSR
jgi:signal transduction histidine kinase